MLGLGVGSPSAPSHGRRDVLGTRMLETNRYAKSLGLSAQEVKRIMEAQQEDGWTDRFGPPKRTPYQPTPPAKSNKNEGR